MGNMKEAEVRDLCQCAVCSRKIGELPLPIFHKISAERHVLDIKAAERLQGLTMQMGGGSQGAVLASIMGPGEDLTKVVGAGVGMVCDECFLYKLPNGLFESIYEDKEAGEEEAAPT